MCKVYYLYQVSKLYVQLMHHLHLASFLLAVSRKSLISSILRGCTHLKKKKNLSLEGNKNPQIEN